MTDPLALVRDLRRPSLLIRAARFGQADYDRDRVLKRLVPGAAQLPPRRALAALVQREAEHEAARQASDAHYSVARHVEVMIAILAEARLSLPAPAAVPGVGPVAEALS